MDYPSAHEQERRRLCITYTTKVMKLSYSSRARVEQNVSRILGRVSEPTISRIGRARKNEMHDRPAHSAIFLPLARSSFACKRVTNV